MEHNSSDEAQLPNEEGQNNSDKITPNENSNVQENGPDEIKVPEDTKTDVGDVHPTMRTDISQEQQNGDSQNQ
jgi:hypothetical protein